MIQAPTKKLTPDDIYIDVNYSIIYEDEAILVVDKPAPLAVHPVGCYAEMNLHSLLKREPRFTDTPVRMVHRLDAETSGLLVIAKTYEAARSLGKQFLAAQIEKSYEAIIFGKPSMECGEIDFSLGYDKACGFKTIRVRDDQAGEKALTRYEVLSSNTSYSRLKLVPVTGRTHQLRAHLALSGNPIVGDKIYLDLSIFAQYVAQGLDEMLLARLKLPRLALHASTLGFTHPHSRERLNFTTPLPRVLREFVMREGL